MAEKKEAKAEKVSVHLNGLAPGMIRPAYKRDANHALVRDEEGNPVYSDTRSIVSIYDVEETRYSFEVPNSCIRDSKSSDNKNVTLYELDNKKLGVTIQEKGSTELKNDKMTPSQLHNIQEEKLQSRHKGNSKMLWMNGIDVSENSRVFKAVKDGKQARISFFIPNGFEETGEDRRCTFYTSMKHLHFDEGDKYAKLSIMSDSSWRVQAEPYRGAKIGEYVTETLTGQQIVDAWDAKKEEYAEWKKQQAAAEETLEADGVEAEAVVAEDELEA